jgi:predicted nucleic acid-binding protein
VIHLDTSFLIRALVSGTTQDQALRRWLRRGDAIAMSTIAWAEFLCGPIEPSHVELAARIVTHRLPFDEADAAHTAELFNAAGRRRGSFTDCQIAAVALNADAPLATANPADFRRFTARGLEVVGA